MACCAIPVQAREMPFSKKGRTESRRIWTVVGLFEVGEIHGTFSSAGEVGSTCLLTTFPNAKGGGCDGDPSTSPPPSSLC